MNTASLINAGARPSLNLKAFTISTWLTMDPGNNNGLWVYKGPSQGSQMAFGLQIQANYVNLYIGSTSNRLYASGFRIQPGRWTHVAVSYDGEGSLEVYLNGQRQKIQLNVNGTPGPIAETSATLKIGRWSGQGFRGRIDEFMIHDRMLSHAEVARLHALAGGSDRTE